MGAMPPRSPSRFVNPPQGWPALAFLGALRYLSADLMEFDVSRASQLFRVSATTLQNDLPFVAVASSVFIFLGLVGSLGALPCGRRPQGRRARERSSGLLSCAPGSCVPSRPTAAGLANGRARVSRRRPAALMGHPTSWKGSRASRARREN